MASPSKLLRASSNGTPVGTGDTTLIAAPGAGNHLEIISIKVSNSSATATTLHFKETAGTLHYPTTLTSNWPNDEIDFLVMARLWKVASNTAFLMNSSAAGSTHYTVDYLIVAD